MVAARYWERVASGSKKVIVAALIGNLLIAITKFIAAAITGSSAMVSEGVHSVVDTGNQGLLLLGLARAAKPADARYPFGHGKEVYFWAFVVAILIFAVGAGISIYQGVHHLRDPEPITHAIVNYVVLGLAMMFEGAAWYVALKEFRLAKGERGYFEAVRKGKDPTLFVVLFEDSAAMLGLMVALVGIALGQWLGNPYLDGVASIVIGLILGGTAAWLAYETQSLLIGESAGQATIEGIRRIVSDSEGVERINEVLTMHMGPRFILLNLSIDFEDDLKTGEVEAAIARLERAIKAEYPFIKRIFVEAESAAIQARAE